ncbi:hypothetical protein Pst134EB_018088 [Puccinia striiformis f. sp. tritici]|nr:hypothetical protein Pst134EB_018088 [Puccinia striiformis f. sp. tritici]
MSSIRKQRDGLGVDPEGPNVNLLQSSFCAGGCFYDVHELSLAQSTTAEKYNRVYLWKTSAVQSRDETRGLELFITQDTI